MAPARTRTPPHPLSANDRFKASFGQWFWASMIVATVAHFAVFVFFPELSAADATISREEVEIIPIQPFEPPPPPEPLQRPAEPVVSDAMIDDDITIAPTTLEAYQPTRIDRPTVGEDDTEAGPTLTPWTVAPTLVNEREVELALAREYPSSLRSAGIGGDVRVWLYIDTLGVVRDQRVHTSSGYDPLDQAALEVAKLARFTAAQNLDRKVPVWVAQVITFQVR